jgi:acetolactate synthase-1/2/3 large subunit
MVMLKWKGYSSPGHLITSCNMGEVGFSISASIGASLAQPEVPSYAFLGDGAFTMQLSALITAVEYSIPIKY